MNIPPSFNQTELLERGWTTARIKAFLGKPDSTYQGRISRFGNSSTPKNGKLWKSERAVEAEKNGALTRQLPKRSNLVLGQMECKPCQIKRHSGRTGGEWRDVPTPDDLTKALNKYHNIKATMRQGGVEFWQYGIMTLQARAPRRQFQS